MADDVQKQLDDLSNPTRTYESYVADLAQRRQQALEDRRTELQIQQQLGRSPNLEGDAEYFQAPPQRAQMTQRAGRPHEDHFDYTTKPSGAYYRSQGGTKQHSGAYFRRQRNR